MSVGAGPTGQRSPPDQNSADVTPTINEIPPLSFTSLFRSLVSKDNIRLAGPI